MVFVTIGAPSLIFNGGVQNCFLGSLLTSIEIFCTKMSWSEPGRERSAKCEVEKEEPTTAECTHQNLVELDQEEMAGLTTNKKSILLTFLLEIFFLPGGQTNDCTDWGRYDSLLFLPAA